MTGAPATRRRARPEQHAQRASTSAPRNAAADGIEDGGGTVGKLTISNVVDLRHRPGDRHRPGRHAQRHARLRSPRPARAEEGIQLAGVAGSFTATTVSLNGMTGDGIDLNSNYRRRSRSTAARSATPTIRAASASTSPAAAATSPSPPAITKTTAGDIVEVTGRTGGTVDAVRQPQRDRRRCRNGIDVNGNTGGTINFTGETQTLTTGANTAVNLTSNTGATINFNDQRRQRPRHRHHVRHRLQRHRRRHGHRHRQRATRSARAPAPRSTSPTRRSARAT